MTGIQSYATYLPAHRVKGRVVASYDEDATTMAVEAARRALVGSPDNLWFATTSPPYLDKNNASAIHAALGLPPETFAVDVGGAARSGFGALKIAAASGGLAVVADVRTGLSGSADEKSGTDGAAAFVFGEGELIADLVATASATIELLDRWRAPHAATGRGWEDRFGAESLQPLVAEVTERVLAGTGITAPDRTIVVSTNAAVRRSARLPVGFAGAADAGLALADALDTAQPGETILLVSLADGCDAMLFRTTDALAQRRQALPLRDQLGAGTEVEYTRYLSWRGLLHREPPRRPEPAAPAGPPSVRAAAWKYSFTGSGCTKCGFVHLPPARVCKQCDTADQMEPIHLANRPGTVATYTVDHLAYSESPPVIQAVIDFDGGGRYTLEVADGSPDELNVGARVALTFRKLFTAGDVHNYFWKATLVEPEASQSSPVEPEASRKASNASRPTGSKQEEEQ